MVSTLSRLVAHARIDGFETWLCLRTVALRADGVLALVADAPSGRVCFVRTLRA